MAAPAKSYATDSVLNDIMAVFVLVWGRACAAKLYRSVCSGAVFLCTLGQMVGGRMNLTDWCNRSVLNLGSDFPGH